LNGKVVDKLLNVRVTVVRFQVNTKYLSLLQIEQPEYRSRSDSVSTDVGNSFHGGKAAGA